MKTEIHMTPESEEEVQVLEQLAEIRAYAIEEAEMSPSAVAGIFAQMSAGLVGESNEVEGPTDAKFECPECERPATNAEAPELGGSPIVQPCGCQTIWDAIPAGLYTDE